MNFSPITDLSRSSLKKFHCGIESLDEYLSRYALTNHRKGISKTFILIENNQIVAYYSIAMAEIFIDELPKEKQKGLPHYPIPAARLARLAVSSTFQKMGYGEQALMDALYRICCSISSIASYGVVVDALNESAALFYKKYGFFPISEDCLKLFLHIETVMQIFPDSH